MTDQNKAEQELGGKIEQGLSQYSSALLAWKSWGAIAGEKVHDLKVETARNILAIIKEAGYKSPGELNAWAEANGYVKLAEDQTAPPVSYDITGDVPFPDSAIGAAYRQAYKNWRIVIL